MENQTMNDETKSDTVIKAGFFCRKASLIKNDSLKQSSGEKCMAFWREELEGMETVKNRIGPVTRSS